MPQSKTQTGKLNKKSKPIQIHLISKDTEDSKQRIRGRFINQKESKTKKKKTGVVTFVSD